MNIEYRCRRCEEVDTSLRFDTTKLEAWDLLRAIQNGTLYKVNGFYLNETEVHPCADGGWGVLELIGIAPQVNSKKS